MDPLVCFICRSQDDLEKLAYQTSQLSYHRYFIIVGFQVDRDYRLFRETDSFLEIQELDVNNLEVLKRLALVYSPPNYENIAFYISNNIISISELQNLFHDLLNGKLTKTDYLFSISRMNFVFEKIERVDESPEIVDYSEIMNNALMGQPISYNEFKIALKELLPEYNLGFDQSCIDLSNDIKNIILDHNKKNFVPKLMVYNNEIKEHEKCIMFFDFDPGNINDYLTKITTIEGIVVYFRC